MHELFRRLKLVLVIKKCENQNYERQLIPLPLVSRINHEQKGLCYLCMTKTSVPKTHHILPSGGNERENLVMLCLNCHAWVHWMLKKHLGWRATNPGSWRNQA